MQKSSLDGNMPIRPGIISAVGRKSALIVKVGGNVIAESAMCVVEFEGN
jgi:hypothetical protein